MACVVCLSSSHLERPLWPLFFVYHHGMAKFQPIPTHLARYYKGSLGFLPAGRMKISAPMLERILGPAYSNASLDTKILALNKWVREEYENTAGVLEYYVWFSDENDAVHYTVKNSA